VIARPGPSGQRLLGYVSLRGEPGSATVDTLKEHLRRALPEYMVPAALLVLPELPLTVNGKLDRERLPDPAELAQPHEPPRTPLEQQIAELWSELLQVPRVGRNDDFFALGGHSLLVTQLASRLQQRLAVSVPLRVLFEAPTLHAFAERVAAAGASSGGGSSLDVLDALLSDLENEV
jgi:acyl carrier protein